LRDRCDTQCRAGAKAALVFHRMASVMIATAAVRKNPAAKHMRSICSAHAQPYIGTCNSTVAATKMLQYLPDSDQQY